MWAKVLSVGVIVLNTSLSWGSDAFAGAVFANHPSTGNHCVDYLKEFPQLAILPFNNKGELSKNSLQKMVKDRFLKSYNLSAYKDTVTFPELKGTWGKDSTANSEFVLYKNSTGWKRVLIKDRFTAEGTKSHSNRKITFENKNGNCVASEEYNDFKSSMKDQGVENTVRNKAKVFDLQVCKDLKDFFAKNSQAIIRCNNDMAKHSKQLRKILKRAPTITPLIGGGHSDAPPVDDIYFSSTSALAFCNMRGSTRRVLNDHTLWRQPKLKSSPGSVGVN